MGSTGIISTDPHMVDNCFDPVGQDQQQTSTLTITNIIMLIHFLIVVIIAITNCSYYCNKVTIYVIASSNGKKGSI